MVDPTVPSRDPHPITANTPENSATASARLTHTIKNLCLIFAHLRCFPCFLCFFHKIVNRLDVLSSLCRCLYFLSSLWLSHVHQIFIKISFLGIFLWFFCNFSTDTLHSIFICFFFWTSFPQNQSLTQILLIQKDFSIFSTRKFQVSTEVSTACGKLH